MKLFGRKKEALPIDQIHYQIKEDQQRVRQDEAEQARLLLEKGVESRQELERVLTNSFVALSEVRRELKQRSYKVSEIELDFFYGFPQYTLTVRKTGCHPLNLQAKFVDEVLLCEAWIVGPELQTFAAGEETITGKPAWEIGQILYRFIKRWLELETPPSPQR